MSLKSKILIPVSAGFLLAAGIASSSFAYPNAYSGASHSYSGYTNNNVSADNRFRGAADSGSSSHRFNRIILDGSSTASHYYRVGVRQFEKGNFDKAEDAFNAVLRANGLNQQAHYYLAKINMEQGDKESATKHALKLAAYK